MEKVQAVVNTDSESLLSNAQISEIENWIKKCMNLGKIPGASVVIVHGNETVFKEAYGYLDIESKQKVTEDTLFELGSTSKAFTGLAILKLQEEGELELSQPISDFFPWFQLKYKGEYGNQKMDSVVEITVEQLLYHTSGIKTEWLGDIEEGEENDALEKMVRSLSGNYLDSYPGEKYEYSSVNYDILGLLIQEVSGETYEDYMKENILIPLGLNQTYLTREEAKQFDFATGYKLGFLKARPYQAPAYRANTPAGYIITNIHDLEQWLKIQNGSLSTESIDSNLISLSHVANRTVPPFEDGASYAAGWRVYQRGEGLYNHGGSNPNYSSSIIFNSKYGIGVLANLDSSYTDYITQGILSIMTNNSLPVLEKDEYKTMDIFATVVFILSCLMGIGIIFGISKMIVECIRKKREIAAVTRNDILKYFIFLVFMIFMGYCLYCLPSILYSNVPWSFVTVWVPFSLLPAIIVFYSIVFLFGMYCFFKAKCKKKHEKVIFEIVVLSCMSGISNAIIIFTINNAVNCIRDINKGIIVLFLFGLVAYIGGQKIIKSKLIYLTNDIIYEKRTTLISNILKTAYDKVEEIGKDAISACLNNDTEVLSYAPGLIIGLLTDAITLVCCLVYLGVINFYGMLLSVMVILFSALLYYVIGKSVNVLLENARENQNIFFAFIEDLVDGFKELRMNDEKSRQFKEDMFESCKSYKESRSKSSAKFVNVQIIGDMLFTIVIAVEVFLFPYIFEEINTSSLTSYILIFLYIAAPVRGILNAIPQLFNINISWKKINTFTIDIIKLDQQEEPLEFALPRQENLHLKLEHISYEYHGKENCFCINDINLDFRSGQIIFITGGNGSGKSTLAKLITGLYTPKSGKIFLNDKPITQSQLKQLYTQVFSDFHLFRKLYGIDCNDKVNVIQVLLNMLKLEEKVSIVDNCFSTIDLSTGQKKRLALLVSYLEDKQIFLFDEWAADQDPEYRNFFYEEIIVKLRDCGKCVIVISHDDRYFSIADVLIKLELGTVESITLKS